MPLDSHDHEVVELGHGVLVEFHDAGVSEFCEEGFGRGVGVHGLGFEEFFEEGFGEHEFEDFDEDFLGFFLCDLLGSESLV